MSQQDPGSVRQIIPRDEYPQWDGASPFPIVRAVYNLANLALNHGPADQRAMLQRVERQHGLPLVMHVKQVMARYEHARGRSKADVHPDKPARRRATVGVIDPARLEQARRDCRFPGWDDQDGTTES